nr:TPA_asm: hexon [Megastigmus wasp adintovirus]
MEESLSVQTPVVFDESIAHYEVHAHQPYTALTFNNSDEIRISIQHQDLCLLPSKSSLHICGKIKKTNGQNVAETSFVNNAICHLFDEIRYEINAIEIDRCKNVGVTSLMKGYASFSSNQSKVLENTGWLDVEETTKIIDGNGNFDVSIPLSMLLGFAEDYRKIVVNVKHELILTRSRNDLNAIIQTAPAQGQSAEAFNIRLNRIEWLMPYVVTSDRHKIHLFNYIQKDIPIAMSFRSWELYEYPMLPATSRHIWTVKTSNQLEKPRFVILAFQTNRKGVATANASRFDHCNITNVKLFLNSQYYPYGNLNLDVTQNQFALLYDMFTQFKSAYYNSNKAQCSDPLLSRNNFITHIPFIVIDCSKQNESLKQAAVDVRLEFETKQNIPAGTCAYCLILHDRIIKYNPISGDVKKIV